MSERLLLTHGCSLSNLPLFVAEQAGFFADEGLTVEAPPFRTMSSTAEMLASGAADLGTAAFTQPLIDSVRDNPPVLVAGSGLRGIVLLAQAGTPSVAALQGRRVGTFRGDPLEVLLHDILAAAGMTMSDVELVYLDDIPAAIESFASGELDAVTFAEPHATRARAAGGVDLSDGRELWGTEFPDTVLVASATLMRDRPEVVPAAIRAMLRGEVAVRADLSAAVRLAAHQFPGFTHAELLVAARNQPPCVDVRPYVDTMLARWPTLLALGLVPAGTAVPTGSISLDQLGVELDSLKPRVVGRDGGDGMTTDLEPTATLFTDILIVAMDDEHGSTPFRGDVLVEGDRISAVGPGLTAPNGARVVAGQDLLVMPGLVNAHVHSWEALFRGRYDNLPLELWALLSYPILGLTPLSERMVYLRSLLVAIESLENGVTCLLDDVIESPGQSREQLDAVFTAYAEIGIRANVSGNVVNRHFIDTLPFAEEVFDPATLARARTDVPQDADDYLALSRETIARWDGHDGLLRYVIAPSGPQRCTDDLLVAADALSAEHDTSLHVHVLETKVQAVTGPELYGRTLVEHLSHLGVLSDRLTIAHGIWLTPHDIDLLAAAGSSVAHNAISNQKLGAGIAPFRALRDAGVNVALGSDGLSSNDSARMFDVMKAAALLHKVSTPDFSAWPTASEVLWAGTRGGAQSARLTDEVGAVAVGRKADLVVLDMRTVNFTPTNDVVNHLVYCENGASVRTVLVNGRVVVEAGHCTRVDVDAVLAEIRELAPEVIARHAEVERANAVFRPYFEQIHRRAYTRPIGINRYSGDESDWVRGS